MAVFDFKTFAKDLTKQAKNIMPKDIALQHQRKFLDKIYNYTYIAGEAFSKDDTIKDPNTAIMLTQVVSEWTFHKYIDLLRSNIPAMYHESIMQKIAFVTYEMTREATINNLSKDEMLKVVEFHLNKAYEDACRVLVQNGQISEDICESALKLSNIDNTTTPINLKYNTYYYTVCALLFALFTVGMNVFYYEYPHLDILNTVALIGLSMYMGFYIGVKKFTN